MKIDTISSPHNTRFKHALKLHTSRGRRKHNQTLVIGIREVARALEMGVLLREFMFDGSMVETEGFSALKAQIDMQRSDASGHLLTPALFQRLTYGNRDSSVIGIAERPETSLEKLPVTDESLIIVLESLEKPGNLGAIVRSADASGCDAVCLADPRTDVFHPNAIRTSVATVFAIPIAAGSSEEVQKWLRENQYRILMARPDAPKCLYETNLTGRVAVVFGSEATGLSEQWNLNSNIHVSLPMLGINDSLNVSVTASLFMYERLRQTRSLSEKGSDPL